MTIHEMQILNRATIEYASTVIVPGMTLARLDDGYSGTNYNRPAIQQLIEDIRNGEILTLITKHCLFRFAHLAEIRRLTRLGILYRPAVEMIDTGEQVQQARFSGSGRSRFCQLYTNKFFKIFSRPASPQNPFLHILNSAPFSCIIYS